MSASASVHASRTKTDSSDKTTDPKPSSHSATIELFSKRFAFDYSSLATFISGSKEIVIYGWDHCKYNDVHFILSRLTTLDPNCPLKSVENFAIKTTLEGREISLIKFDEKDSKNQKDVKRVFKTTLTNLVLENIKRIKEKKTIIPVIFIIDIDDNAYPFAVKDMLTKDKPANNYITNSELRRACKLCTDVNASIREAAQQTFKFVKLTAKKNSQNNLILLGLEKAINPYQSPLYRLGLLARKEKPVPPKTDAFSWRKQLNAHVSELESDSTPLKTVPANTSNSVISKK